MIAAFFRANRAVSPHFLSRLVGGNGNTPLFSGNNVHRPEKVDTEKIFQLNNFSKVDNSDNFV